MSKQRIRMIRQAVITWCVVLASVAAANAESAKDRLLKVTADEQDVFTPKVREAFLAYAKAQARIALGYTPVMRFDAEPTGEQRGLNL